MRFTLPYLKYGYDALEPYLDKKTMEIHHSKHHQTYINNANEALENLDYFSTLSLNSLIKNLNKVPLDKRMVLINNAGGHINHSIFWECLKKGTMLHGELKDAIENNFVTVENFKTIFENTAMTCFGSGWSWLIKKDGKLYVKITKNQDNPLMGETISGTSGYPIFGLDLWEHAYYLKYQNRRLDYIKAFWQVINWDEALYRFKLY